MLVAFILGIAAGWAALSVEPRVAGMTREHLGETLLPEEVRALSYGVLLVAAALLLALLGEGHPLSLALGGVLGLMGPRLRRRWEARKAPDYDA